MRNIQSATDVAIHQARVEIEAMREWVINHFPAKDWHQCESVNGKLAFINTILTNHWISEADTYQLHSLGIFFGDALAQELNLHWVVVEDEFGQDPALQLEHTCLLLFPKTMLSRRMETGEHIDVFALFETMCEQVSKIIKRIAN